MRGSKKNRKHKSSFPENPKEGDTHRTNTMGLVSTWVYRKGEWRNTSKQLPYFKNKKYKNQDG